MQSRSKAWRLAAVGALTAYASIFSAVAGFIGLTWALLASSMFFTLKAVGFKELKKFFRTFFGYSY